MYKRLWSWIGGRPWTLIMRDSYDNHPIFWLLGALGVGLLGGHLFWGKARIHGEGRSS